MNAIVENCDATTKEHVTINNPFSNVFPLRHFITQPSKAVMQTITGYCARTLNIPISVGVQTKFLSDFSHNHCFTEILLACISLKREECS